VARLVDGVVDEAPDPRVAVLVGGHPAPIVKALAERYPTATVRGVNVTRPAWQVWARLAGSGPLDLLVDLAGSHDDQVSRFCAYFQFLRPGGRFFAPRPSAAMTPDRSTWSPLGAFLERLSDTTDYGLEPALRTALLEAVGGIRAFDDGLVVTQRGRSLALLREREINQALRADPSRGRVLVRVPGVTFGSRCELRTSGPPPRRPRTEFSAPPMFLREYLNVSCAPRGLVIQRNLVAPDSFRHADGPVLGHQSLRPAGPRFARIPFQETRAGRLEGTFFHLDNPYRGHFGHALTDQVSRLWAWQQAKAAHPDLRVLLGVSAKFAYAEWERTLFSAAGIEPADIEIIAGPVHVDRLLSSRPMFAMPKHVHPGIVDTWDRIGAALRAQAPDRDYPARIFIGRRHRKRRCENGTEVEALFSEHGFETIYPEEHPLPVQAELFHRADVIAGFAGSGLFSVIFTDLPKHLIVLNPSSYRANNEQLIASVRGHRLDLVVCQSSVQRQPGQRAKAAKNSPFRCDMDQEGRWLQETLRSVSSPRG
jgi:capsular polysaccharide biosynthesis protein